MEMEIHDARVISRYNKVFKALHSYELREAWKAEGIPQSTSNPKKQTMEGHIHKLFQFLRKHQNAINDEPAIGQFIGYLRNNNLVPAGDLDATPKQDESSSEASTHHVDPQQIDFEIDENQAVINTTSKNAKKLKDPAKPAEPTQAKRQQQANPPQQPKTNQAPAPPAPPAPAKAPKVPKPPNIAMLRVDPDVVRDNFMSKARNEMKQGRAKFAENTLLNNLDRNEKYEQIEKLLKVDDTLAKTLNPKKELTKRDANEHLNESKLSLVKQYEKMKWEGIKANKVSFKPMTPAEMVKSYNKSFKMYNL